MSLGFGIAVHGLHDYNAAMRITRCLTHLAALLPLLAAAQSTESGWNLQAETDKITASVAAIRDLELKRPVVAEIQAPEALAAHIRTGLLRQFGEGGDKTYVDALVRLGALKEPIDLGQTIIDMATSQAAAHYDPGSGKFYLLMTNMPLMLLGITASHELCHALQDQHFNLAQFMEGDLDLLRNNQDAMTARQFLVEGDATHVMTTWMAQSTAGTTNPATLDFVVSAMMQMQASLDFETLCEMGASMASEGEMDFMMGSLEELKKLPRFFVEPLYEAYLKGGAMVDGVKKAGGWAAVDALFTNPPASSEQVLHPEKLKEPRDNPVELSLEDFKKSLGADWLERERDVMGELGIRVLLKTWLDETRLEPEKAAAAAAGWGGDCYALYENTATDATCLLWRLAWDTESDAAEFAMTWRWMLGERFPALTRLKRDSKNLAISTQAWEVSPARFVQLRHDGLTVEILDTTAPQLLASPP